jgi:hypothetical protein
MPVIDEPRSWKESEAVKIDTLRIEHNQRDLVDAVNANPEEARAILLRIEAARGNTASQRALLGAIKGAVATQPAQGANQ